MAFDEGAALGGTHLPLRGQHRLPRDKRVPVSRFTAGQARSSESPDAGSATAAPKARAVYQGGHGATMVRMVEELDALDAKMRELAAHVRQLREENQSLRRQLAASQAELAALNERVTAATRRLDTLIEELPGELRGNGH